MDVTQAANIARSLHKGQKYRDREYIDHVSDVARRVTMDPRASLDHIVVAWLKDVIERGPKAIGELDELKGCTDTQLTAVFAISRLGSESYTDYLTRALENPIASLVKLHEVESNLTQDPPAAVKAKYLDDLPYIRQAVANHESRGAYPPGRP